MAIFAKRNNGSAARDSSGRYDVTHPGSSPAQKRDARGVPQPGPRPPATDPRNGRPMSEQRSSQAPRPPEPPIKIGFEANSKSGPELSRRATKRKDKALKNMEPLNMMGDPYQSPGTVAHWPSQAGGDYSLAKKAENAMKPGYSAPPRVDGSKEKFGGMPAKDAVETYVATGGINSDAAQAHNEERAKKRKEYG